MDERVPILQYDNLPEGSDIRRVQEANGVTITVPAGEPGAGTLRRVRQRTMLEAGAGAAVATGFMLLLFMLMNPARLDRVLLMIAGAAFGVLCFGVFLLIWITQYSNRMTQVRHGRQQATVLHVSPERLLVETTGPLGTESHEIPASKLDAVTTVIAPLPVSLGEHDLLHWLELRRRNAPPLRILPGRDPLELRWIAGTIGHVMGVGDG